MNLIGKAVLKVEEIIENANGTLNVFEMWDALDRAFLPIDHHESKYRQFATRHMRQGEWMTKYLDELVCLFSKSRPCTFVRFQNDEVKNHLLTGLPSVISCILSVSFRGITASK